MNPTARQIEDSTARPKLWTRDPMIVTDKGVTSVIDYGLVEFGDEHEATIASAYMVRNDDGTYTLRVDAGRPDVTVEVM